jgi:hypothetical protein
MASDIHNLQWQIKGLSVLCLEQPKTLRVVCMLYKFLKNSLIIHEEKTKEIIGFICAKKSC